MIPDYINLTSNKWDDSTLSHLQVIRDGLITRVAKEALDSKDKGYLGVGKAAQAIDEIALKEAISIGNQARETYQPKQGEPDIKKMYELSEKLNNLTENLRRHNKIILQFNQNITKKEFLITTHEYTLSQVDVQQKEVSKLLEKLQAKEKIEKAISNLETRLKSDPKNVNLAIESIQAIPKEIKEIGLPKQVEEELLKRCNVTINKVYAYALQSRLSEKESEFYLSHSMKVAFERFGINLKHIKLVKIANPQFLEQLKKISSNQASLNEDSQKFISSLQSDYVKMAVAALGLKPPQEFVSVLNQLNDCENRWIRKEKVYRKDLCSSFFHDMQAQKMTRDDYEFIVKQIENVNPKNYENALKNLFEDKKWQQDVLKKAFSAPHDILNPNAKQDGALKDLSLLVSKLYRDLATNAYDAFEADVKQIGTSVEQKNQELTNLISEVEKNIKNGQVIDDKFIAESYPAFIATLNQCRFTDQVRKTHLERYTKAVNKAYLENVSKNLWRTPDYIKVMFKHFGIDLETKETQELRSQASAELTKLVKGESRRWEKSEITPLELIQQVQFEYIDILCKKLKLPKEINVVCKNIAVLKFLWISLENKIRNQFCEIWQKELSKDLAGYYIKKYGTINPEMFLGVLNDILAKQLKHVDILKSPQPAQQSVLDSLQKTLTDIVKSDAFSEKILDSRINKALNQQFILDRKKSDTGWSERNAKYRLFEFDQSTWGDHHVLGRGCCLMINYRWVKGVMKNPTQKFSRVDELDPELSRVSPMPLGKALVTVKSADFQKMLKEKEQQRAWTGPRTESSANADVSMSGWDLSPPESSSSDDDDAKVTAHDRFMQASRAVEFAKTDDRTVGVSDKAAQKDGFKKTHLVNRATSIVNMIDQLVNDQPQVLLTSGGAIDIYMGASDSAHEIGMQIDQATNTYRFWDVNSGFYSYDTLDQLKKEMSSYLTDVYDDEFKKFYAIQYVADVLQAKPASVDSTIAKTNKLIIDAKKATTVDGFLTILKEVSSDPGRESILQPLIENALSRNFWDVALQAAILVPNKNERDKYFSQIVEKIEAKKGLQLSQQIKLTDEREKFQKRLLDRSIGSKDDGQTNQILEFLIKLEIGKKDYSKAVTFIKQFSQGSTKQSRQALMDLAACDLPDDIIKEVAEIVAKDKSQPKFMETIFSSLVKTLEKRKDFGKAFKLIQDSPLNPNEKDMLRVGISLNVAKTWNQQIQEYRQIKAPLHFENIKTVFNGINAIQDDKRRKEVFENLWQNLGKVKVSIIEKKPIDVHLFIEATKLTPDEATRPADLVWLAESFLSKALKEEDFNLIVAAFEAMAKDNIPDRKTYEKVIDDNIMKLISLARGRGFLKLALRFVGIMVNQKEADTVRAAIQKEIESKAKSSQSGG